MFHQQALRRMSRGEADETFMNPVISGFNPDPSIIRVNKDYFLTTSSFEFTPGAPIYHSTDLIQWTLIGHALTRRSQLDIRAPEPGGGVWACTLRYHDQWFFLTTCVWDRYRPQETHERAWPRGFYVKTRDIWDSDSWTDPVYFDQPGFDQDLFWDHDGQVYLSTTCRKADRDAQSKLKDLGIHICTIDLETGNSTSASTLVRESKSGIAEGSHLLKHRKYYYLFTAEGGTESGHSEYCFRSEKSPLGPWEECPQNPLINNSTDQDVQNTGHCDFVQDPIGRWWAFCLAVRPQRTDTGWVPSLFGWYRKNTAVKPESDISLSERPNYLRIKPGPYSLASPASPTAVFRKLTHNIGTWKTRLSFFPDKTHTEAGSVAYWNYLTWSSIGIRYDAAGGRETVFRGANKEETTATIGTSDAEIDLVISVQALTLRFGYQEAKANAVRVAADAGVTWLGQVAANNLTEPPPIGNHFTGVMCGLYAWSEMGKSTASADFAFAEFL